MDMLRLAMMLWISRKYNGSLIVSLDGGGSYAEVVNIHFLK